MHLLRQQGCRPAASERKVQRHRTGFPYAGSRTSTSAAYYFCTEESRAACRAVVGLAQEQFDFATGAVSALSTAAEETARAPHGSMNRLSGCLRKSRGNTEPTPGFYAASVTKACLLSRQPGRSISKRTGSFSGRNLRSCAHGLPLATASRTSTQDTVWMTC